MEHQIEGQASPGVRPVRVGGVVVVGGGGDGGNFGALIFIIFKVLLSAFKTSSLYTQLSQFLLKIFKKSDSNLSTLDKRRKVKADTDRVWQPIKNKNKNKKNIELNDS